MSKFVFTLVSNMTMREKAYFRRYSNMYSNKSDKNYILLYNCLEGMTEYDFEELIAKFSSKIMSNHLTSELNYLSDQLLKSLINFHLEGSINSKLQKSILFIDILIQKGFRKQALKKIKSAKKSAYANEKFTLILNLIQFEEAVLFKQGILGFAIQLKTLNEERTRIYSQIGNLNHLKLLRQQIRELWFSNGYIKDPENYPNYFDNSILKNQNNSISLKAKEHWLYCNAMLLYILQKHHEAMKIFSEAILFLEENPRLFSKSRRLALISNYLFNCAYTKDDISFNKMILKLKLLNQDSSIDSIYCEYIVYSRSFELYYQNNDTKSTHDLVQKALEYINKNVRHLELSQSNYLYFLLVRSCIVLNNYSLALSLINKWHSVNTIDYYLIHLRIFTLIVYLELDYFKLLQTEVNTSNQTFSRLKVNSSLSKEFIRFFRKYLRSPKKLFTYLKWLSERLDSKEPSSILSDKYKYFDYLIWIKSKLQRLNKIED